MITINLMPYTKMEIQSENISKAMNNLDRSMSQREQRKTIPFDEFLRILSENPGIVIRSVFQLFYDMMNNYVGKGKDEYPGDPESINFVYFDCNRLFVEGVDHPFFADRLFANRLINHVEALKRGAQQNKIYIFDGPPGCGKSTFLNNLLMKFEEYANTEQGMRYEVVWRLDRKILGGFPDRKKSPIIDRITQILDREYDMESEKDSGLGSGDDSHCPDSSMYEDDDLPATEEYVEVPCPSHDNPILIIPKNERRAFFDDLLLNDEIKWKLFTEKEYEWIFRDNPCTICSSLYNALLNRLKKHRKVFQMVYARPYRFNRRMGEGISVFNPGDKPMRQNVLGNPMLQRRINQILRDSNEVKYLFSRYAKTNNGIYALMDIKSHNIERLIELHNIISEAVHKVEDIEENVTSLFMALMNPEDKKNIQFQSFSDRIEYINIPYVLDLNTEVSIYRNIFGKHIDESFLPRILHNFARVIISSRLNTRSDAMLEWIEYPSKYSQYCDDNLHLLKMEIYTGFIPPWLSEEDRKRFTAKRRRQIIAESEKEGNKGFSGRDSIKIFNEFYSTYAKSDRLITMSTLINYFTNVRKDLNESIPNGFTNSLLRLYNYTILQEVKESLYYYNEDQIHIDIKNYLFAVNFDTGAVENCHYTGEKIEVTDDFFESIEKRLLGAKSDRNSRIKFRKDTQKEYTSRTLTQEILTDGIPISETKLFKDLYQRYIHNLKEKVLEPFLENENFRQAIKDFDEEAFKTYDKRIRDDVTFLINNLCSKYRYTKQGAKEVCIYVVDNDLAKKFSSI